jgi:hypothetical protein
MVIINLNFRRSLDIVEMTSQILIYVILIVLTLLSNSRFFIKL